VRKTDDVFFFTLVDFLLQAFFFGLLLYVLNAAKTEEAKPRKLDNEQTIERFKKLMGVSNLTETTDLLTTMAPVDKLRGVADFLSKIGGVDKAKAAFAAVSAVGGPDQIRENAEKARKYDAGAGLPHCLLEDQNNPKKAKVLASVVVSDTAIRFKGNTPDLEKLLKRLGTTYSVVQQLPFGEFRRAFEAVTAIDSNCRYTLLVEERTVFVYGRREMQGLFNSHYGK
jgi:hypothetical protein